jgi:hypothetical protein
MNRYAWKDFVDGTDENLAKAKRPLDTWSFSNQDGREINAQVALSQLAGDSDPYDYGYGYRFSSL